MILVTGGTGLLGSHLLFHLVQNNEKVRALKRKESSTEQVEFVFKSYGDQDLNLFGKIEWQDANMLDINSLHLAFDGIKTVFHCAATVSFNPSKAKSMINNNIAGTGNLIDVSLEQGVDYFCHVSSVAALGSKNIDGYRDENSILKHLKGLSPYAISKFKSELEVWRGISEGLNAVIVNPSIIMGPGTRPIGSLAMFNNIKKGLKYYPPGKTGFVDVRDVVKIMLMLYEEKVSGERFVLNAQNLSFKEVFNLIAQATEAKIPKKQVTPFLAKTAIKLEWFKNRMTGLEPRITKHSAKAAFGESLFSSEKIQSLTKWKFIPIKDTILFTASALKTKH